MALYTLFILFYLSVACLQMFTFANLEAFVTCYKSCFQNHQWKNLWMKESPNRSALCIHVYVSGCTIHSETWCILIMKTGLELLHWKVRPLVEIFPIQHLNQLRYCVFIVLINNELVDIMNHHIAVHNIGVWVSNIPPKPGQVCV